MSRKCTIPSILGLRGWWETRFSDLCEVHDYQYQSKIVSKWKSDSQYSRGMRQKGYFFLSFLTLGVLTLVGWVYWYGIIK